MSVDENPWAPVTGTTTVNLNNGFTYTWSFNEVGSPTGSQARIEVPISLPNIENEDYSGTITFNTNRAVNFSINIQCLAFAGWPRSFPHEVNLDWGAIETSSGSVSFKFVKRSRLDLAER